MPVWSVHVSFAVFCVGIPVSCAYRTGSFFKTVLTAWISIVVWFFVMGLFVSPLVGDDPRLGEAVPDGPAVAGALLMGWLPGIVIAVVAMVIARIVDGFVPGQRNSGEATDRRKYQLAESGDVKGNGVAE